MTWQYTIWNAEPTHDRSGLDERVYVANSTRIIEPIPFQRAHWHRQLLAGKRYPLLEDEFDYIRVPPHPDVLLFIALLESDPSLFESYPTNEKAPTVPAQISRPWFEAMREGARAQSLGVSDISEMLHINYLERYWSATRPRPLQIAKAGTLFSYAYRYEWITYSTYLEIERQLVKLIHATNWLPTGRKVNWRRKRGRLKASLQPLEKQYPDWQASHVRAALSRALVCEWRRIAFSVPALGKILKANAMELAYSQPGPSVHTSS